MELLLGLIAILLTFVIWRYPDLLAVDRYSGSLEGTLVGSPWNRPVVVNLGEGLRAIVHNPPTTILRARGEPLLQIGLESKRFLFIRWNKLKFSARLYDPSGRIVADLADNRWTVNPNNYFSFKASWWGRTFRVGDQFGQAFLNLYLKDSHTVNVEGVLYKDGTRFDIRGIGITWTGGGGIGNLTIDVVGSARTIINYQ